MKKNTFKKAASALALSLTLALAVPAALPTTAPVATTAEAASKLSISATSKKVLVGQSFKLKVKGLTKKQKVVWKSSKSSVASVAKNGTVTVKQKGTATISAKVGKKTLKCKVTALPNQFKYKPFAMADLKSGLSLVPTNVYYKNGKLYCKARFYNKTSTNMKKIVKLSKAKLVHATFVDPTLTTSYATKDVTLATGTVTSGLPKSLKPYSYKDANIVFSGKQLKKKGYDLTTADLIFLQGTVAYYK